MAFGVPHKYIYLDPNLKEEEGWNEAIKHSDNRFKSEEHNLFW